MKLKPRVAQLVCLLLLLQGYSTVFPATARAEPLPTKELASSLSPSTQTAVAQLAIVAEIPWHFEVVPESDRWQPTTQEAQAVLAEARALGLEISLTDVYHSARFLRQDSDPLTRVKAAVTASVILGAMARGAAVALAELLLETWWAGELVPDCEDVIETLVFGAVFGAVDLLRVFKPLPTIIRYFFAGLDEVESASNGLFSALLAEAVPEHLLLEPVCDFLLPWRWDNATKEQVTGDIADAVFEIHGDAFSEALTGQQSLGQLASSSVWAENVSGDIASLFEASETVFWTADFSVREAGTYEVEFLVENAGQEFSVAGTSLDVTAENLSTPVRWTGSVPAGVLPSLDPGSDDTFVLNLRIGKEGETHEVAPERRPAILVRSVPNEAPMLLLDTEIVTNVLTVEGKYFDPDETAPTLLDLSISGVEYDQLPDLVNLGAGVFFFSKSLTLPDGIHPVYARFSDGVAPIKSSATRQIRASSTPPDVDLDFATSSITLGEEVPFTVSVVDALGPVPDREIQLARDGRGGFLDASSEPTFLLTTNSLGVASGTYIPANPGQRTVLAREKVGNRFDFGTVTVEANNPQDWDCVVTWTLLSTNDQEATYRCDVVITFQGGQLDIGDRVYFSANHGSFLDEYDGVGSSGQATNEYTVTAAEADLGDEVITLEVPEWGVALTKVTNLAVGQPESFEVFRTLNYQTDPAERETLSVAMSQDGHYLGGIEGRTIRIWELPSGALVHQIDVDRLGGDDLTSLDFSPDGSRVVAGDEDGRLVVADLDGGNPTIRSRTNGVANIMGVSWFAADRIAAITDDGNTLNTYRPRVLILDDNLTELRAIYFADYQVGTELERLKCVEANSLCAVASRLPPTSWYLFNTSGTILGHGTHPDDSPIFAVSLSPRGDRFVVAGDDNNGGAYLEVYQTSATSSSLLGRPLTTNSDVFGATFFDDEFGNRRLLVSGNNAAEEFDQNGGGILRSTQRLHLSRDSFHLVYLQNKGVVAGLDKDRQSLINVSGDIFPPSASIFDSFNVPFSQTAVTLTGDLVDPSGLWTSEYRRDGGGWVDLVLGPAGEFEIAADALPVGETLLEIRSKDYFGNEGLHSVTIVRQDDLEPPFLVNWAIDPEVAEQGTVFTLTSEAFDTETSVASVEATVSSSGSPVTSCTLMPLGNDVFQCQLDSTALPLGILDVDLTAVDTSSNANARTLPQVLSFEVSPQPSLESPSSLTAVIAADDVLLSWQDNSQGEDGFRILRTTSSGSSFSIEVASDSTSWLDESVLPEAEYCYQVLAFRSSGTGDSEPTPEACIVAGARGLQFLQPDSQGMPSEHSSTLQWTDNVPGTDARLALYYDTDDQDADGTLIVSGLSEDDATDTFSWRTTFVPPGEYWIYGVLDDGINPPTTVYAPGSIQVVRPTALTVCGSGCDYSSFGTAIADAAPGARIQLGPGIFPTDQVFIDKELTIQGAGVGSTILRPTSDSGTSGDDRGWWVVDNGVPLRLGDVTLDGSGYQLWQGIRHRGSGLIERVQFTDIGFHPSVTYQGTALVAYGDGPVLVLDSEFRRIGRSGVLFFGSGVTGSQFRNSTYIGKGDGDFLDYGVEVGAGASVVIAGTTISACRGVASADGSTSAGILVNTYFGSGSEAKVSGTALVDSAVGLRIGIRVDDSSLVTAHYNSFSGNSFGIVSTGPTVAGENNYWGSESGPTHADNPSGTGDGVDDEVSYLPYLGSWSEEVVIQSFSPVDLEVLVAGLVTSKTRSGFPTSTYEEGDFNGDGETNDRVTISNAPPGRYRVVIYPDESARPGDTYSLTLSTIDETLVLASDAPVPVGFTAEKFLRKHTDGSIEYLNTSMTPPTAIGGFEEGSGDSVSLGENLEGTLQGTVTWGRGQGGSALIFDGGGYVQIADPGPSALDFSSALTVALWVRPDALGGTQVLVSKDDAYELEIGKTGPDRYDLRLGNVVTGQGASALQEGIWQHLAVTWDGTMVRYYLNGEADGEVPYTGELPSNDFDIGLGARPSEAAMGGPTFFFTGAIDDLVLYDRALSAEELATLVVGSQTDVRAPRRIGETTVIVPRGPSVVLTMETDEIAHCRAEEYRGVRFSEMEMELSSSDGIEHRLALEDLSTNEIRRLFLRCRDLLGNTNTSDHSVRVGVGASDLAAGLVSFYPMDDGGGCAVLDALGTNDATLEPACPENSPNWVAGVLGGGLEFAGGSQEVAIGTPRNLSPFEAVTLAAWIRHSPTNGSFIAIIDRRDSGTDGFDLFLESSSRLFARFNTATSTSSTVVADNRWHHVAATYDGIEIRLYVDGLLDSITPAQSGILETSSPLHLGKHFSQPTYSFAGTMDEVLLYDRALTGIEVLDLSGAIGFQEE